MRRAELSVLCILCVPWSLNAHEGPFPRDEPTYTIAAPATPGPGQPSLILHIRDASTGAPTPARFSITLDGKPWTPAALDNNGLLFTSIHTAKKQRATFLYTRGTGPVAFSLPAVASRGEITVTKGYEYVSETLEIPLSKKSGSPIELTADLKRWSNLRAAGWLAADEHLHYERSDPAHDVSWFTMLAADGLDQGFFMILDGGNFPGVWSQQYAYGRKGRVTSDGTSLVPGEEFRGSLQGHNNLHGIAEVLSPMMVGRSNIPSQSHHWPTTHDVLRKVSETGGIGGPAHGGTFGKASTAVRDAVLGASEFFELANTHLYELQPWYRLMNCGYLLPPVAGTDLPNFPWREPWQPFLGETRTYVRVDDPATADFESWKTALRSGRSFITSGPLLSLSVNGMPLGERIHLDPGDQFVEISAVLSSPFPPASFEIIQNGEPLTIAPEKTRDENGIHRWKIEERIKVSESTWIAARGTGLRKNLLWAKTGVLKHAVAHTAAVPVFIGGRPIFDNADAATLITGLEAARGVYAAEGRFPDDKARDRTLLLFDAAIKKLRP